MIPRLVIRKTVALLALLASLSAFASHRPTTGYFYFQLNPTATDKPIYFSQVVALAYSDNVDLQRKQDSCVKLLRTAAGNPPGYNDSGSLEHKTKAEAQAERDDNIAHLRSRGATVKEKTI